MDRHQRKAVHEVIDNEGFEYAFVHYTDFEDVEDEKFHDLRKIYLSARKQLREYLELDEDD